MEWLNRSKSIRGLCCAGMAMGVLGVAAAMAASQPVTVGRTTRRPAGAAGQAPERPLERAAVQPGNEAAASGAELPSGAGRRWPSTPTQPNNWTQITITEHGQWHVARFEIHGARPAVAARAARVQGPGSVQHTVEVAVWPAGGEVDPERVPESAIVVRFSGASGGRFLEFLDTVEDLNLSATPEVIRRREVRATMPGAGARPEVHATVVDGRATVHVTVEMPMAHILDVPAEAMREAIRPALEELAALREAPLALAMSEPFRAVVFGAFDLDNDGAATMEETEELVKVLESRGATIVDELGADVDYVVLGERPQVPPPPQSSAGIEELTQWQRQDRAAKRWRELYDGTREVGIPVLNMPQLRSMFGL